MALFTAGITPVVASDAPSVEQILLENPDPFADYDMQAIVQNYGADGSGIGLIKGGIGLQIERKTLVSDVRTIGGATGLISDPTGFGFQIALSGDYLFAFDKSDLNEKALSSLDEVLALYQEYEGTSIEVSGHTDAKGSDDYNQTLSEQRAGSVASWFTEKSIDGTLITAIGFGESKPVAENTIDGKDNPEGRAKNRRVDISIKTKKRVNSVQLAPSE